MNPYFVRLAILSWRLVVAMCAVAPVSMSAQEVSSSAAQADLDTLRTILRKYSSYRLVNGYPYERHLDSLKLQIASAISVRDFGRDVQILIGRLQEAHSVVRLPEGVSATVATGELPFEVTGLDTSVVALAPCGCALLAPDFPWLRSINGVPIDRLMRIAGIRFVGHSPQRFRKRALQALRPIEDVLVRAGVGARDGLVVRLSGAKGDTTIRIPLAARRASVPTPTAVPVVVRGNLVAFRIPQMWARGDREYDAGYQMVKAVMESKTLHESRGILIDVRDNDGGTRDILDLVVPYFIQAPLVYNFALVRGDTNGVGERSIVSPDDPSVPRIKRDALRSALASFTPPAFASNGDFLPQRFGSVLLPIDGVQNMSDRPVVVSMNEGSFSATDNFLGR